MELENQHVTMIDTNVSVPVMIDTMNGPTTSDSAASVHAPLKKLDDIMVDLFMQWKEKDHYHNVLEYH